MNYYKFNFNNIYYKANLNLFEFYLFFFMFLIFIYLLYQRNFLNFIFIIYFIFNCFKINNVHIFFIFISYFVCKVMSFLFLNFFEDLSKDFKIYITMIMLYK